MRILHVIPAVASRYGGPSEAVLGMCRALEHAGTRTLIASTDADGAGRLNVPIGVETQYAGLPAIFFRRHLTESFKWSSGLAHWLDSHVGDFGVVHVHAVFSHSSIAAGRACRARVPYVVRPLGTLDPWSVNRKRLRKQVVELAGARSLLRGASLIHYTTLEEQRLAEATISGLPRGRVVPLGLDDSAFAVSRISKTPGYILTMSRLHEKKRIDLIIAAFHLVQRDGWRLVIAGDGESRHVDSLKRLASSGPAAAFIDFVGWVEGKDKADLLGGASFFALASHQENFGLGLVEAMAAGLPVLTTPGANLSADIAKADAGWVVELDEHALANALTAATCDLNTLEEKGRNARTFAEQFRWPVVASQLVDMYRGIAQRRPETAAPIPAHHA